MEKLYEVTVKSAAKSGGLKLAHKFGREHVHLTSYSRMRVDLAAQVHICTQAHAYMHTDEVITQKPIGYF